MPAPSIHANTGAFAYGGSGAASATVAGVPGYLVVHVCGRGTAAISTPTANGVSMTPLYAEQTVGVVDWRVRAYGIAVTATGSITVSCGVAGDANSKHFGALMWKDVDSTTPIRNILYTAGNGSSFSISPTSSAGNTIGLQSSNNDGAFPVPTGSTWSSIDPMSGGDGYQHAGYATGGTATLTGTQNYYWQFTTYEMVAASGGDTTPPTLTSPTGTATGSTTATGTVSTDEGNGTLYRLASTNATETAATVKAAALTQAVSATGVQNVSFTGLSPGTTYYAHYVHADTAGNDSLVADSPTSFTTSSAVSIDTPTRSTPTATTVAPGFTTNAGSGTARGIVIQSATQPATPSVAQVKAGQNAAGTAVGVTALTNLSITSAGAKTFSPATVTTGLTYWPFAVHTDGSGNDSAVLVGLPHYPGTGRPVADVSVSGWTVTGAASGSAALSEDAPGSDAEYITSPALSGTPSAAIFTLDKTYPAGTYGIKVRASSTAGTATLRLKLYDSAGTLLGTSADQVITTTPTVYTLNVTIAGTAARAGVEVQA